MLVLTEKLIERLASVVDIKQSAFDEAGFYIKDDL